LLEEEAVEVVMVVAVREFFVAKRPSSLRILRFAGLYSTGVPGETGRFVLVAGLDVGGARNWSSGSSWRGPRVRLDGEWRRDRDEEDDGRATMAGGNECLENWIKVEQCCRVFEPFPSLSQSRDITRLIH
jgi:hypothetical protein